MKSSEESGKNSDTTRRDFLKNSAVAASAAVSGAQFIAKFKYRMYVPYDQISAAEQSCIGPCVTVQISSSVQHKAPRRMQ